MKTKRKLQSQKQIEYVFSFPISFSSCATISYPCEPDGFSLLNIKTDRGEKAKLREITISTFGNEDKRVLGVRTRDESAKLDKEDLLEFDKSASTKSIFPKGIYQKINPMYQNTHHKKI